jgi:AraC-like DNA-binding protein
MSTRNTEKSGIADAITWPELAGVTPAVRSSAEWRGQHVPCITRSYHRFWALDYVFLPHGSVRVGSLCGPWRVRPAQTAHLYAPCTPYWEDTRMEKGPRHSAWVLFSGGEHAGLAGLLDPGRGYACFLDPQGILGSLLAQATRSDDEGGEAGFWEAQAALCRVLHLLVNAERVDEGTYRVNSASKNIESKFVREVNRLLGRDLAAPLSLARVAAEMHVSVSALSHRYKREVGMTPMAARRALRIHHAKIRLVRGFPLKLIAQELGFSDAFHLSKAFKQVTGLAPRHFLRK